MINGWIFICSEFLADENPQFFWNYVERLGEEKYMNAISNPKTTIDELTKLSLDIADEATPSSLRNVSNCMITLGIFGSNLINHNFSFLI